MALLPTSFTVGTEDYPLSRRLYLYAPAVSANDLMRDFVDFALSAEGQDIVQKVGFVSQNLGIERPHIEAGAPSDYRRAAENAGRLSLNFRFELRRDGSIDCTSISHRPPAGEPFQQVSVGETPRVRATPRTSYRMKVLCTYRTGCSTSAESAIAAC